MTRLAMVMIARDEAARIGRALDSARPHVDRMIVLDTGSADDTAAVARAHGAEVHHFIWCDDFSAARNAALDRSDAAWNLIMDADDWIEGNASALSPDRLPEGEGGFLGYVQATNRVVQDGGGQEGAVAVSRSWIPRVLPRGVRYQGSIHEQPASILPGRRLELRLAHDGFLPEALARKAGRNEALLAAAIGREPGDGYLWFQLGREHQARERAAEAADAFARALNLTPSAAAWRHALVVRAVTALKTAGLLDEAMALADAEVANWPASPDFFFAVGDLYLEQATRVPDRAVKDYLPIVEYAWKKCLEIGDRDDLDGSVAGRGGYTAAHNLALMFATFGLEGPAAEYRALAETLRAA